MYNLRRTCTDRRATIYSCEVYMYVLGVCVCVCVCVCVYLYVLLNCTS